MNPPAETPRGRSMAIATVIFVSLLAGAHTLVYPFGTDQGEYAVTAEQAMQGRVVYRDVFCVKPPFTYLLHELAFRVFGRSMMSIRALNAIWQAATAVVILLACRRAFRRDDAALAAGLAYPLLVFACMAFWADAQTDGFLNLPVALAVWAALAARDSGDARLGLLSGAAVGAAVSFKYPIGVMVLFVVAWLLVSRAPRALLMSAAALGGFVLVLLTEAAVLGAQGALSAFWTEFAQVTAFANGNGLGFNPDEPPAAAIWHNLRFSLRFVGLKAVLVASLLGMIALWWRGARGSGRWLVLLWWLAAAIHIGVQKKFYLYHWLTLLAPTAVLIGVLVASVLELVRPLVRVPAARIIPALAVIALAWLCFDRRVELRSLEAVAIEGQSLRSVYRDDSSYSIASVLAVGDYIRAGSAPDEPIFVWGFNPTIYFASQRPPASRFLYNFVLYGRWDWRDNRVQCMEDLAHHPPRYIVVNKNELMTRMNGSADDGLTALRSFPQLYELLSRHYSEERTIGPFSLFRRSDL